jgi:outer membrane receptor protein involved in Fe transport
MSAVRIRRASKALLRWATMATLSWAAAGQAQAEGAVETAVQLPTVEVESTRASAAASPRSSQWLEPEELALTWDPFQALALAMPGLSVVESGFDTPTFHLRGVGNYDINPGGRSSIGLQLDGVPLVDTRLARLGFLDLERVEVRPGPRSAEGASGQSAGTIDFVSVPLLAERPASLQASVDTDQTLAVSVARSGRWRMGDEGAYRFSARGERAREGWQVDLQDSRLRLPGPENLQARLSAQTRLAATNFRLRLDWMERGGAPQSPQFFAFRNDPSLPGARPSAAVQDHPQVPDGDARRTAWNPDRLPRLDERLGFVHLEGRRSLADDLLLAISASGELSQSDNLFNSDGLYVSDLDYTLDRDHRAVTLAATLSGLGGERLRGWSLRGGATQQRVEDQRLAFTEESSAGYGGFFFRSARLDAKETSDAWFLRGQLDWQLASRLSATSTLSLQTLDREFAGCTRDSDGTTAPLFQLLSLYTRLNGVDSLSVINGPLAQSIGAALPSNPPPPAAVSAAAAALAIANELGVFDLSGALLGGPQPGDCITLDAQSGRSQLVNANLEETLVSARQEVLFEPSPFDKAWVALATGTAPGSFPSILSAISSQYRPARR